MKFSDMNEVEKEVVLSGKGGVKGSKSGRKEELLEYLKVGMWDWSEMSRKLGVSKKNISSLKNYLVKDGIVFKEFSGVSGKRLMLSGRIVDGVIVDEYVELGKDGYIEKFDINNGCWESEVVKIEEVVEVVEKVGGKVVKK